MTLAASPPGPANDGDPLSPSERRRLGLAARLPLSWTISVRRRRLLLLGLAAPGFLLVATTPWHRLFTLLALVAAMFAAALVFRRRTEPAFVRAEAPELWLPPLPFPCRRPHA